MEHVVIGVDPHKLSATIEVVDDREQLLGSGRFTTDRAGYSAMRLQLDGELEALRMLPDRREALTRGRVQTGLAPGSWTRGVFD